MTNNLFPVFDVPATLAEDTPHQEKYNPAPLFDLQGGDFVLNGAKQAIYGSGRDAWVFWCVKTIMTQRWAHYGYSSNAGIEAMEAFSEPDRAAQVAFPMLNITGPPGE